MGMNLSNLEVLIVDDIPSVRALLRSQLRAFGIRNILEADDGITGLEVLTREKVDLVITDWAMKPMDGVEFTRRLRANGPSKNQTLPVLMVSNHTEYSLIQGALDAGITQFLAKPLTTKSLGARLTAMFDDRAAEARLDAIAGSDRRRVFAQGYSRRRKSDWDVG